MIKKYPSYTKIRTKSMKTPMYVIQLPCIIKRREVTDPTWELIKNNMLQNVVFAYEDAFAELEKDIRNHR